MHGSVCGEFADPKGKGEFNALSSPLDARRPQAQLVGTTGFSWAGGYNKNGFLL